MITKEERWRLRLQSVQFWMLQNVFWREWSRLRFCRIRKFDLDNFLLSYDPGDIEFVVPNHWGYLVSSQLQNEDTGPVLHYLSFDIDFPVTVLPMAHGDRLFFHKRNVDKERWYRVQRMATELGIGTPVKGIEKNIGSDPYRFAEMIDDCCFLDLRCDYWLIPSSTFGHFHLYIRRYFSWDVCEEFLRLLMFAGLVEEKYYALAVRRKMTTLLRPGLSKEMIRRDFEISKEYFAYR